MTALKQKPNGIYYLDTEVPDGKGGLRRSRVGLRTKDRAEAEAQRRDWIAGVHPLHPAVGGVIAPKGRGPSSDGSTLTKLDTPLVSSWLARCLTEEDVWGSCRAKANHRSNVRILSRLLPPDLQIGQLGDAACEALAATLRDDHDYAPATRAKLLGSLSSAARYAVKKKLLATMPNIEIPKFDNEKTRTITLDEEEAILNICREQRQATTAGHWWHFERLLILAAETGCRKGELMLAGPSWIKKKRRVNRTTGEESIDWYLGIPKTMIYKGRERLVTKNTKPRDVPLTSRAVAVVEELGTRADDGLFFPWPPETSSTTYNFKVLRERMKAVGYNIDDVSLHTYRHTCATRLCEGGLDIASLSIWLGHSDIKVTWGRYIHLTQTHTYAGVAALEAFTGMSGAAGR